MQGRDFLGGIFWPGFLDKIAALLPHVPASRLIRFLEKVVCLGKSGAVSSAG